MKNILVYADSLSWGIIPNSRSRLSFDTRWPGVLEKELIKQDYAVRIHENCLNGRRTCWSDPFKAGRDGSQHLAQVIEMHSPLDLVILMLGHNDFQCTHQNNAWLSAQGIAKLIDIIQLAPIEPGMPIPQILIVAPPQIMAPKGPIAAKFEGAETRCIDLSMYLQAISEQKATSFFDSNAIIHPSKVDGIHLDQPEHKTLGFALVSIVQQILNLE